MTQQSIKFHDSQKYISELLSCRGETLKVVYDLRSLLTKLQDKASLEGDSNHEIPINKLDRIYSDLINLPVLSNIVEYLENINIEDYQKELSSGLHKLNYTIAGFESCYMMCTNGKGYDFEELNNKARELFEQLAKFFSYHQKKHLKVLIYKAKLQKAREVAKTEPELVEIINELERQKLRLDSMDEDSIIQKLIDGYATPITTLKKELVTKVIKVFLSSSDID